MVALAALAGAIAAGTQFSSIGQLEWSDGRLNLAIDSATVGLLFVGIAVGCMVSLSTSGCTTLESLSGRESAIGKAQVERECPDRGRRYASKRNELYEHRGAARRPLRLDQATIKRYRLQEHLELDASIKDLGQLI
jgi:hypothetical protein